MLKKAFFLMTITVSLLLVSCSESSEEIKIGEPTNGGNTSSQYIVIDVSDGTDTSSYPVAELDTKPSDLTTNDIYKTTKIVLRRITGGTVTIGSPSDELGRYSVETQHQFTLTDYYMGVFEITQKQYELVMGTAPSKYSGNTRPVEFISWDTIRGGDWPDSTRLPNSSSFIGALQSKTNLAFDLPTEAQWEYACRAGTTKAYNNDTNFLETDSGLDSNLEPLAWYFANSYGAKHHSVGTKQANDWGLYDMHGNIAEWCLDWYDSSYSKDTSDANGFTRRVIRGGSYFNTARHCRSAFRSAEFPNAEGFYNIGFRLAFPQTKE